MRYAGLVNAFRHIARAMCRVSEVGGRRDAEHADTAAQPETVRGDSLRRLPRL
jgi:hypothetical protein